MKDNHIHSTFSDGKASIDEMVEAAKALGYEEVVFAEHFNPFLAEINRKTGYKMHIFPEEIESYFLECEMAEQKHQIRVLKGFEVSWISHQSEETKEALARYMPSLDMILISAHHLELLKDFKRTNGTVEKQGYSMYLGGEVLKEMIRQYDGFTNVLEVYAEKLKEAMVHLNGFCQNTGVAHLVVFSNDPCYNQEAASPIIRDLLSDIKGNGFFLEVNFHYYRKGTSVETRPYLEDAVHFLRLGGSLAFASDAHSVEDLNVTTKHYPIFERLRK